MQPAVVKLKAAFILDMTKYVDPFCLEWTLTNLSMYGDWMALAAYFFWGAARGLPAGDADGLGLGLGEDIGSEDIAVDLNIGRLKI